MSPTLDRRRALTSLAGLGAAGFVATKDAVAQATPSTRTAEEATIVVTATGRADAPATVAIGQVVVRASSALNPVDDSGYGTPDLAVVSQDDIDTLIGALTDFGIDSSDILSSISPAGGGYFGPSSAVIIFQVRGEAIKTLAKALKAVTDAAIAQGVPPDPPSAMMLAESCDDMRGEAFVNAVAAARADAELLATATGVGLGPMIQATKLSISYGQAYTTGQEDTCDALVDLGTALRTYLPQFDASAPNVFSVLASVQLTFAIA